MSSVSRNSKIPLKKKTTPRNTKSIFQERRRTRRRVLVHARRRRLCKKAQRSCIRSSKVVSDKLEALKNLLPANNGDVVKPDQLFQETADYIVLLKTQVFVLQRLIDFYGSTSTSNPTEVDENAAIL